MSEQPRREPLKVRPEARFTCAGDGLCCSDIHSVGALTEQDCQFLSVISEDAIDRHEGEDAPVLMMRSDTGRCVFWSDAGCALHAKLGPEMKPSPCIQFPYGLTATPTGGRISTQHRCPCRTVGPRPPVTVQDARPCVKDTGGELNPDHAVQGPVAWSASESLPFAEYETKESWLIESLVAGDSLRTALQAEPFPKLEGRTWSDVAVELQAFEGTSRAAFAARWFGDALGYLIDRRKRTERERPWADSFERAATRIVEPEHPNKVFGDWLADEVWGLRWTQWGSLRRARAEWATRLIVARTIAAWLDISNPTQDNLSAAEAVMIVDVIGATDPWEEVQRAMVEP